MHSRLAVNSSPSERVLTGYAVRVRVSARVRSVLGTIDWTPHVLYIVDKTMYVTTDD